MPTVAVMGGIGSGKTAVTDLLAARGAAVVDADVIARETVAPGSATLAKLVERFGSQILASDGSLDRAALAALGFADNDATAAMNAIMHPAIGVELLRQVEAARDHARVVVVAIPLFRVEHRALLGIDEVVCVDCPTEVAVERLVAHRGFDPDDARRRIAQQASPQERRALSDVVIDNSGGLDELRAEVDDLWRRWDAE